MPGFADHHRVTAVTANPFEQQPTRLTRFSAQEIATLQSRLDKQLGPEYISTRAGPGGSKVHYLAAEKVISLANEVFGFNGWSSQVQSMTIDFEDELPNGRISLGLAAIVRVSLQDGAFHEDVGYGSIENCKGKAAAFEKARKEATTDAVKRALRNFGNVLGNCLYDKDFLLRIAKVKAPTSKWSGDNLHRHSDFVEVKKEPTHADIAAGEQRPPSLPTGLAATSVEFEDDFEGGFFDEVELNDDSGQNEEASKKLIKQIPPLPPHTRPSMPQTRQQSASSPQAAPGSPQSYKNARQPQTNSNSTTTSTNQRQPPIQAPPLPSLPQGRQQQYSTPPDAPHRSPHHPQSHPRNPNPPIGFITSRAATLLASDESPDPSVLAALPKFNPNLESPSIRKTAGVDHAKSTPVRRENIPSPSVSTTLASESMPPPIAPATRPIPVTTRSAPPQQLPTTNYINPSENPHRRIGMPVSGSSPMAANRSAYKPPGPALVVNAQGKRPALADVSNTNGGGMSGGAGDAGLKKIKVDPGLAAVEVKDVKIKAGDV